LGDRLDKKLLLVISEFASAALVVLLIFFDSLVIAYVSFFLLSVFTEVFKPVQRAALPELVSDDDLVTANSMLENTTTMSRVAGPGIAGLLIAIVGIDTLYALDAVSYAISGVVLFSLPSFDIEELPSSSIREDLQEGIGYISNSPTISVVIGIAGVSFGGAGAFNAILPLYVRDALALASSSYGTLAMLISLGAFVCGFVLAIYGDQLPPFVSMAGAVGIVGVGIIGLATVRVFPLVAAIAIVMGFSFSAVGVFSTTMIQRRSEKAYTGRTLGVYRGVNQTTQLISMAAAGVLTATLGIALFFWGVGLFFVITGLFVLFLDRRGITTERPSRTFVDNQK
jgi:MFS family permease